ncbi:MAG: LuxR C-terminal-related transcriptional regulator [Oscillospiraceae bacterium]|nr:LuxR C-terminal-related transcriptional regulator [Oscillospiraceae bacterium]
MITVLSRRRITQKFLRAKKTDEIILVTAPLLFGKTTAVIDAMETLQYNYLHLRFEPFMNRPPFFLNHITRLLLEFNRKPSGGIISDPACLLDKISGFVSGESSVTMPDAFIIDDFHLCRSEEAAETLKSFYRLCAGKTSLIIISRTSLSAVFNEEQCRGKIKQITAKDLAFSQTEIKKSAEHNKLHISTANALRLARQSCGSAGFIAETLYGGGLYDESQFPKHFCAALDYLTLRSLSENSVKTLSALAFLENIPAGILKNMQDNEALLNQLNELSRTTGLIDISYETFTFHGLLKLYLEKTHRVNAEESLKVCAEISRKLLSMQKYSEALTCASASTQYGLIEEILQKHLEQGIGLSLPALEKLQQKPGENPGQASGFLINLYNAAHGDIKSLNDISVFRKHFPNISNILNTHIFTSPYPNENTRLYSHIFSGVSSESSTVHDALVKCGELYFNMEFEKAFTILEDIKNKCDNQLQPAYFTLSINVLRELFAYGQADSETQAFQKRVLSCDNPENSQNYKAFRRFQAELFILKGDISAAKEWLSSRAESVSPKICFANIEDCITDALAFIADDDENTAIIRLKDLCTFAETLNLPRIETTCLVLFALAFQKKQQLPKAVRYMEKAIALAEKENLPAAIARFGTGVSFLIEKCYWRSRKKAKPHAGETQILQPSQKILLHVKNKKNRTGGIFLSDKNLSLSKRQKQMLLFLSQGFTYNKIAEDTALKITTVRDHIKKLYEKLEVRNSADAIIKAQEKGLI